MSQFTASFSDEDADPPLLTDSETESFTESPNAEEGSELGDIFALSPCQSEDSTVLCDMESEETPLKRNPSISLIDKSMSLDEDCLMKPLEPIRCDSDSSIKIISNGQSEEAAFNFEDDVQQLTSILRQTSCYEKMEGASSSLCSLSKQVSFPEDKVLLLSYNEPPEPTYPWIIPELLTPEAIIQKYQSSCKRHKAVELDSIKQQLREIKNNTNRTAMLNLASVYVSTDVCETLEDLLKITNFCKIVICENKFTTNTIQEFLDMLEYYESTTELVLLDDFEDVEMWKTLATVITKSVFLACLSFEDMAISEQCMRILLGAVNCNDYLQELRFDACSLVKLPSFYLVENLINNRCIRELCLTEVGLYTKEADCLGRFLSRNTHLKVLDISNNLIGDRGLEALAKGLTTQTSLSAGLSVLVVVNNQLTEKCGPIINNIIMKCGSLHTLNIGFNKLKDEVLRHIARALEVSASLEGLGLQSTLMTCTGAVSLAEALEINNSLQKINLKGNKAIQCVGVEKLSRALTVSKVIKLEIDDDNRSCTDPQTYHELVKKINRICDVNHSRAGQGQDEEMMSLSQLIARKVSLSCDPRHLVILPDGPSDPVASKSPTLSPIQSPSPVHSRFQVVTVKEKTDPVPSSPAHSRFKVCAVESDNIESNVNIGNNIPVKPEEDKDESDEN